MITQPQLGCYNPVFHLTTNLTKHCKPSKAFSQACSHAKQDAPVVITQVFEHVLEAYFLLDPTSKLHLFPLQDVNHCLVKGGKVLLEQIKATKRPGSDASNKKKRDFMRR